MRIFVLIAALLAFPAVISADCPKKPVAESGGWHWCYSAGERGNVHLWTPDGYDPKTAVTVVYIHGHDIDASPRGRPHYLDRAWSAHGLAKSFAASGLSALFIAVEGPVNNRGKAKWTSLEALLGSVRRHGGIVPPRRVVAAAHSAGIFTAMRFLGDKRLAHVIVLDALYRDAPERLARWYRGSKARRLTIVGASCRHAPTAALSRRLACADDLVAKGRCAALIDAGLDHMEVVMPGGPLASALTRIRR